MIVSINRIFVFGMTFLCFSILLVSILIGFHEFELWGQVVYLWDVKFPIHNVLLHPHGLRYFLVYPIFILSNYLSVSYDFIFSLVACLCMSLFYYLIIINAVKLGCRSKPKFLIVLIMVLFVSLNMNGRLVFALLGASIFLFMAFHKTSPMKFYLLSIISFMLSSVSSGTISVFIIWYLYYWLFFREKSSIEFMFGWLFILLSIYAIFDFVKLFVLKNINFFGGGFEGVINMLSHGFGKVFLIDETLAILIFMNLILILITVFIMFYFFWKGCWPSKPALMTIGLFVSGAFMGLFGISTALYSFPLILLTFLLFNIRQGVVLTQK